MRQFKHNLYGVNDKYFYCIVGIMLYIKMHKGDMSCGSL
jgi:hypothetical protein